MYKYSKALRHVGVSSQPCITYSDLCMREEYISTLLKSLLFYNFLSQTNLILTHTKIYPLSHSTRVYARNTKAAFQGYPQAFIS